MEDIVLCCGSEIATGWVLALAETLRDIGGRDGVVLKVLSDVTQLPGRIWGFGDDVRGARSCGGASPVSQQSTLFLLSWSSNRSAEKLACGV